MPTFEQICQIKTQRINSPRFDQVKANIILQKCSFVNKDMVDFYQANFNDLYVAYFCYFNNQIFDLLFSTEYVKNVGINDNIFYHYENINQIFSLLNKKCDKIVENGNHIKWTFGQYGFSIETAPPSRNALNAKIHKGLWFFEYLSSLPYSNKQFGIISGNDILRIFENPELLNIKPDSIKKLEDLFGIQATRHIHFFGRWVLKKPNYLSISCNPFGLDCGQSNSSDNFDICYYDNPTVEGFATINSILIHYNDHINKMIASWLV